MSSHAHNWTSGREAKLCKDENTREGNKDKTYMKLECLFYSFIIEKDIDYLDYQEEELSTGI